MGKSLLYFAVILFSSLILAIGWVDLSLGSKRIELGPLGLPVSYNCPEKLADAYGVEFDRMDASKQAILEIKKHVQSVEMMVLEKETVQNEDSAQAGFVVSVVMNSGNQVQSRMQHAQWKRLDRSMAQTIRRCVDEFMAYKKAHRESTSNVLLTI